ncbi:MAG: DUF1593 domain-containing protein, partial [Candidatus Eisenbacteria bacterium]|nr:DUF1593 domain-containing protein [Candidatus Eisenbacteria bacterium]
MTKANLMCGFSVRHVLLHVCVLISCSVIGSSALAEPASRTITGDKPRYLVLTDMAHDDPNSMTRLLCYANEIDIEAIIVTPLKGSAAPGPDLLWNKLNVRLDAYGEVVANLKEHDPDFPSLAHLRSISFPHSGSPQIFMGDDQFDDYIGTGLNKDGLPKSTAATDHLKKVFARNDPRPIHVGLWGGAVPLVQALWEYKQEVSASQFDALVDKLHIWDGALQDVSSDYLADVKELSSRPGRYNGSRAEPAAYVGFHGWGHYLQNDYIDLNRIRNAGGALTAPYGHGGEGDTPSFLHLVSAARGLNDPTDYRHHSWGGNFYPAPHAGPGAFADQNNQEDNVTRWLPIARDDFYGRAEWAVKSPAQTDYRPNV